VSEKTDKIKKHFRDHKEAYIVGGICLAVGVTTGIVLSRSTQIAITNPALMNWKPVSNVVQVQMVRPGPKAFVVQCVENQTTWPSMRAAAEAMNVNRAELINHLKGLIPDVNGLHFEKVAEI
jgi:hypothetical protein